MSLAAGTRLGPYEIHSLVGAGGMGEVYRAYLDGAPTMPFLGVGWWDVLRGQPRLIDFARRIGLPPSVALPRS